MIVILLTYVIIKFTFSGLTLTSISTICAAILLGTKVCLRVCTCVRVCIHRCAHVCMTRIIQLGELQLNKSARII